MSSRGRPSKQGTPFDRLIKQQCQKAVATKSMGLMGRWGSFSSVRPLGGSTDLKRSSETNPALVGAPKPKKFFKSREAPPAEEDFDFTDSAVSQIVPMTKSVPAPQKRVLKPLEPKPPAQQIQAPPPPEKAPSKFFHSKVVKPEKFRPEPVQDFSSKPRRAAAMRVTKEDYAESSDDDMSIPAVAAPPPPPPVVVQKSPKMFVSKGKPYATQLQQQQQQLKQQQQTKSQRPTRQRLHHQSTGKTVGNSEESEEGSSEESDPLPHPTQNSNKFFSSSKSTPPLAPSGHVQSKPKMPIVETPTESSAEDAESNLESSEDEPDQRVIEDIVPPLKVPPLKLILKPIPNPEPVKLAGEKRANARRTRYQSNQSEPDEKQDAEYSTKVSEVKENEKRSTRRTRYQSNQSETDDKQDADYSTKVSEVKENEKRSTRRTRYQSNQSEPDERQDPEYSAKLNEVKENEKRSTRRTRYQSNQSETDEKQDADYSTKMNEENLSEDEMSLKRHPSRTRNNRARNPKPVNDGDSAKGSSRSTRHNKPLAKIVEEEQSSHPSIFESNFVEDVKSPERDEEDERVSTPQIEVDATGSVLHPDNSNSNANSISRLKIKSDPNSLPQNDQLPFSATENSKSNSAASALRSTRLKLNVKVDSFDKKDDLPQQRDPVAIPGCSVSDDLPDVSDKASSSDSNNVSKKPFRNALSEGAETTSSVPDTLKGNRASIDFPETSKVVEKSFSAGDLKMNVKNADEDDLTMDTANSAATLPAEPLKTARSGVSALRSARLRTLTKPPKVEFKPDVDPLQLDLKPEVPEENPLNSSSLLTRATTVASDSNIAAELKRDVYKDLLIKEEESSSSQPLAPIRTFSQKRSIFKSKTIVPPSGGSNGGNGNKKGLSLYKHKWNTNNETEDFKTEVIKRVLSGPEASTASSAYDDDFGDPTDRDFSTTKMVRVTSDVGKASFDDSAKEVVTVKCHKAQKEYFTVIKNVKKAHQIQDSGEFQEFNDDVEYILGGLGAKNSLSTRCLSTVTLASKCMEAPFRMHLRAHGTVTQFFGELKDAPQNPSLALCAATVLFVLSQDRLNMDLDRDSLELMLNLLDTDSRIKDALENSGMNKRELEKNKQKVQELCGEMKKKGHAANLSLDHISADHLSMETLLSLTSKRAGEWFKEELRELGGLDHLVKTMSDCVNFLTVEEISLWTDPLHTKLKKADRVLKVLESVTSENEENCDYLLEYNKGQFLDVIHRLYKFLDEEVPLNSSMDMNDRESVSHTLRDCLFSVIRVYINLVHDYRQSPKGSELACEKSDLFEIVLHCLFVLPDSLPVEKRFDVLVLTLTFIINLVEHSEKNRQKLMKAIVPQKTEDMFTLSEKQTANEALVNLFLQNEENARNEESKTDQILDGVKDDDEKKKEGDEKPVNKTREEVIDETVAQLLNKAGKHMENTLIASYITLIIGYLILDDKENEGLIRDLLPDNDFSLMASVLKKFFNFMNLTASATVASSRGIKATEKILKHLETIDKKVEEKPEEKLEDDNYDDVTLFDVSADDGETTYHNNPSDDSFSMTFGDDFGKL